MRAKRKRWSEVLIIGGALLVACNFALNFAHSGQYFLELTKYVNFREALPFQYRVLMVPIFRVLNTVLTHIHFEDFVAHAPEYLQTPDALSYFVVNAVSFLVAVLAVWRITVLISNSNGFTWCAVLLFVVIVYETFILNPNHPFILPYDLPSLAFLQMGTLCILRQRWKILIGLFAVATINRETTFLLVLFLLLLWWFHLRRDGHVALVVAGVLSAIWIALKFTLFLTISGDGFSPVLLGGISAWRITDNFIEFLKPWQWPALLPNFIPGGIVIVLIKGRLKKYREWHLTAIVGYAALFPVGLVTEFRAFADLIGFFAISLTLVLQEFGIVPFGDVERADLYSGTSKTAL